MKLSRVLAASTLALALFTAKPAAASTDMWINMKIGPSIGVSNAATQFALQFEFAKQLVPNGYLLVPLQFQFGKGVTAIGLPLGFQYDFPFPGVKNLYIYPRIAIGYAIAIPSGDGDSAHAFLMSPGFGIKYVLKERFQFGFEPFELPIAIGDNTAIGYRLNFYAGLRF